MISIEEQLEIVANADALAVLKLLHLNGYELPDRHLEAFSEGIDTLSMFLEAVFTYVVLNERENDEILELYLYHPSFTEFIKKENAKMDTAKIIIRNLEYTFNDFAMDHQVGGCGIVYNGRVPAGFYMEINTETVWPYCYNVADKIMKLINSIKKGGD